MKEYLQFFHLYTGFFARFIRLLLFLSLSVVIVMSAINGIVPKYPMFFYGLFILFETFFHYKIAKVTPSVSVSSNNKKNVFNSFTRESGLAFVTHSTSSHVISSLLHLYQVQFLLQKANITLKEVPLLNIPISEFSSYSCEIAKYAGGEYVTSMDVVVAYLLIIEPHVKLLFAKEIKSEELVEILKLTRTEFPDEQHPKKARVEYKGEGVGEGLVTGWTPFTMQYTKDITYKSMVEGPFIVGRDTEFSQMLSVLSKKQNNNVLLVGERGAGKDAIVESFSYKSHRGELKKDLNHKRVLELLTGLFVSGTTNKSDLETRIQEVIDEISHGENVILFVPNISDLIGGNSTDLDMSTILLPYLKEGKLPTIATVTPGVFKKILSEHPLMEVFEVVQLAPSDAESSLKMVFAESWEIEEKEHVSITYRAMKASVEFAHRFVDDSVLPGAGVRLLEEAAHRVSLAIQDAYGKKQRGIVTYDEVVKTIEIKTKVSVAKPEGAEKELLLHLEDELHKRVVDQIEGITVISEALRRIRTGLANTNKPISFLFLGPTGVGKTETAKALSEVYFHGQENMIRLDMSEYVDENGIKRLLGAAPGEGDERGELTDKIHENPFSLVLLDEFEKANPRILDLFLQVLEDGRLTDNKGRTVSFVNAIIIATSNAGAEFIRQEIKKGTAVDKEFQKHLLDFLQGQHIFKPELLNRFDAVVTFKPLGKEEVIQITHMMLSSLTKKMQEKDITLSFDEKVVEKIVTEGANEEFGARPLKRYIQDNLEDLLAQKMLKEEIKRGDTVNLSTDSENALQVLVVQ